MQSLKFTLVCSCVGSFVAMVKGCNSCTITNTVLSIFTPFALLSHVHIASLQNAINCSVSSHMDASHRNLVWLNFITMTFLMVSLWMSSCSSVFQLVSAYSFTMTLFTSYHVKDFFLSLWIALIVWNMCLCALSFV